MMGAGSGDEQRLCSFAGGYAAAADQAHAFGGAPRRRRGLSLAPGCREQRFLPTYTSAQGRTRKAARPVRVELGLPQGVKLISGRQKTELGHLEGRGSRLSVSAVYASSPTDNRAWIEWILQGAPGDEVKLDVLSDRAGSLHGSMTLP